MKAETIKARVISDPVTNQDKRGRGFTRVDARYQGSKITVIDFWGADYLPRYLLSLRKGGSIAIEARDQPRDGPPW